MQLKHDSNSEAQVSRKLKTQPSLKCPCLSLVVPVPVNNCSSSSNWWTIKWLSFTRRPTKHEPFTLQTTTEGQKCSVRILSQVLFLPGKWKQWLISSSNSKVKFMIDFQCTIPPYKEPLHSDPVSQPKHTSAGSLVSTTVISMSWSVHTHRFPLLVIF